MREPNRRLRKTKMSTELHEAGTSKSEIETPALLIDLPTMEKNIQTMAQFFRGAKAKLRPHVKLHKGTPALAQLQVGEGTVGVTCAKLSEAEAVATAGIRDILIANQIVGSSKIRRLMALAKDANVIVAVDDDDNISQLSQAAASSGIKLRVLVEVNIGNNRCGVAPLGPALELARVVYASPGLTFSGLM
jgi:D-serine deaminase-like pyridoxal phosphate-dependent protein